MIREAQKAHGAAVPIEDAIRVIYEAATCSRPLSMLLLALQHVTAGTVSGHEYGVPYIAR